MRLPLFLLLFTTAVSAVAEVRVSDAWVRATPPGARTAAAYLTLTNDGGDDALTGAWTDVAQSAELHTHVHEDGMMKMTPVASIPLPAGGRAELRPHGDHLMLLGLQRSLAPGETVILRLRFERGDEIELSVPVRDGRGR